MQKNTIPFVAAASDRHSAGWVKVLQNALPEERIIAFKDLNEDDKQAATMAIVANPNPDDLRQLPRLLWVQSVWAGVERLVSDLGNTGLKIVRLVDPQMAETMSEAVLAWTLYLHRNMPAYAQQQRQLIWQEHPYIRPQRKNVGLLGLGALGTASARRLVAAGFQVCGWSRTTKSLPGVECYSGMAELDVMLAKTDILVCLVPLTSETRGLLDKERFAHLRRGASLINFARGPVINDDDLRAALDSGAIDHAVLDVFTREPLPTDQWQWKHPRVTVLPHCTAPTDRETGSMIVADNIRRYRETGALPTCVDTGRGY